MLPKLFPSKFSKKTKSRKSSSISKRGFTIIEFAISFFLLILIVYIFLQSIDNLRAISRSRSQVIAYHIASRKIESLRKTPFSTFPPSGQFSDSQLSKIPFGQASLTVSNFEGKQNIKQIVIKVWWTEKEVTKQVNLDTLIHEKGLHKD